MALVAPTVLAAAIYFRPPEPVQPALPIVDGPAPAPLRLIGERAARIGDFAFVLRHFSDGGQPSRHVVEIDPERAPADADVLVYWSPETATVATLPPGARLLGRLAGAEARRFALPEDRDGGVLLLYTLAAQRLLGPPLAVRDGGAGQ